MRKVDDNDDYDLLVHARRRVRHVFDGERVKTQLARNPVGQRHLEHVVTTTQQRVVLAVVTLAANTRTVACNTARDLPYHSINLFAIFQETT